MCADAFLFLLSADTQKDSTQAASAHAEGNAEGADATNDSTAGEAGAGLVAEGRQLFADGMAVEALWKGGSDPRFPGSVPVAHRDRVCV